MLLTSVIRRHPVTSYYVLAFAVSWGGVLAAVGGPGQLIEAEATTGVFLVGLVATLLGPAISGVVMTAVVEGREGFVGLRSRLRRWRVGGRWYGVALLVTPVSVTVTLLALSLASNEFVPGYLSSDEGESALANFTTGIAFALIAGLITGFMEELGWTGFALPRLRLRHGLLATGILMGLLWGAWHLVANLWGSEESSGSVPLALYMAGMLFTFLPPFRVLMVWVYEQTESLLLVMLMHASLVGFWLISTPQDIDGAPQVIWYTAWAGVLWVAVAVVWLRRRARRPSTVAEGTIRAP